MGAIVLLFAVQSPAAEDPIYGKNYVSVLAGYVTPAKAYGTTGSGSTISVLYGHQFNRHVALEVNAQSSTFETGIAGGTDFYQHGVTADAVFFMTDRREAKFIPFVLAGAGAAYDDFNPNDRDGTALIADAGLGLITPPLVNIGLRFRADVRYVYDAKEGGHGEGRYMLGVDIPLGRIEKHVEYLPGKVEIREVVREVVREVDRPVDSNPCPNIPRGFKVNLRDCTIDQQIVELHGLTFEFNKARLTPDARTILDIVSPAFTAQPSLRVEVAGHTDTIGTDARNLALSQQRADAVRAYLVFKGARPDQLTARGYGKSQLLINPENGPDDRERNRRVELRVVSP